MAINSITGPSSKAPAPAPNGPVQGVKDKAYDAAHQGSQTAAKATDSSPAQKAQGLVVPYMPGMIPRDCYT